MTWMFAAWLCAQLGMFPTAPSKVMGGHKSATVHAKRTFSARGVIRSIGPSQKFVWIAHEAIDGFMGAMAMSFATRDPKQLEGLHKGDTVGFTFTVDDDERCWLDAIRRL